MKYPYSLNMICERTESIIGLDSRCAKLFQVGDVIRVAFLLPESYHERMSRLVDDDSVNLYRDSVWILFRVVRREFFFLDHGDKRLPESGHIFVEPVTLKAFEAMKFVRQIKSEASA